MTVRSFLHSKAPPDMPNLVELTKWAKSAHDSFYKARHGKLDCVGTVTLTANAASTTLTDRRISPQSVITFDPTSANAATELYGATMYVLAANRSNGSCVITHANNAQTDRTFNYSVIG